MDTIEEITRVFKALGDLTRLRIVRLLAANNDEICVCELVDSLEEPQFTISRHLSELRDAGLITSLREGNLIYYTLAKENPFIQQLAELLENIKLDSFHFDQMSFEKRMKLRFKGRCKVGIQKRHLKF